MKLYWTFLISTALFLASCGDQIPYTGYSSETLLAPSPAGSNSPPVIQQLTANPTARVAQSDRIGFTLEAFDADHDRLSYYWSTDRGTLSAQEGLSVWWQAQAKSGVKAGVAEVRLLVSDGKGGETTATLRILVDASGQAQIAEIRRQTCGETTADALYSNPEVQL